MRYFQLLEGVQIDSKIKLAAYAITVAEAYDAAPISDGNPAWDILNKHNVEVLFKHLQADVKVEFVPEDPYAVYTDDPAMSMRFMLYDMCVNKVLKVYSGHSDTHPRLTANENIIFRTVHDYYTHAKLMKSFKFGLEQVMRNHPNKAPTPEELLKLLPNINLSKNGNIGHGFTLRGELNAYSSHMQLAPKAAAPALFTEVVGQVCYKIICGDFPEQKASVLSGFIFNKIGMCERGSAAEHRMLEISSLIMTGQKEIKLHLKGKASISVDELMQQIVS